jgi:phosphotransacetylase
LQFLKPVAVGDRITATVTLVEKLPKNRLRLECLCTNQKGEIVVRGEAKVLAPAEKVSRPVMPLPIVELHPAHEPFYVSLLAALGSYEPLRVAVVHPADGASLQGAIAAAEAGLITPLLVGPKAKIMSVASTCAIDLSPYTIIDTPHSNAAAEVAVAMAHRGEVEALMKGKLHTDELMAEVVAKGTGLRTARRMSHVFVMELDSYPRPLFITDAVLNIEPTLMDKVDITQNAIDLFRALGMGTPKVAILSAVETVNEQLRSTLDATALCKMAERGQITGALLDGPLAFDNAISLEAAAIKGIHSAVAGQADILVVPDMESGNMLFKQMCYFSDAEGAGLVMGARVPIILTSRASDANTRLASAALALLYCRRQAALSVAA